VPPETKTVQEKYRSRHSGVKQAAKGVNSTERPKNEKKGQMDFHSAPAAKEHKERKELGAFARTFVIYAFFCGPPPEPAHTT
jgi:hypothetical protein